MKEIIAGLRELNELDNQLRTIRKDLERLPKELADRETLPKNLRGSIERAKAEAIRLKIESDAAELEVKSGEDALKRYAGQLNITRTSKEFEATRRQMDAQRTWNKENETKALTLMEQIETTEANIHKNSQALAEAERELAVETERVQQVMAELTTQQDRLLRQREILAKDIPDKELATYNRIVATRGVAIAVVDRGICSACYMKIPPQIHNLAILGRDLVCCPSCGRILTAS